MDSNTTRRIPGFFLILSLLGTTIILPPAAFGQQADKDAKKETKTDGKDKQKATPKPSPTPGGTLGEKDDPSKIGKRNINKGSDKLFGWFGGSREKEMQIGRQMAMQVEQQAKMVEDPVVTEYVNRVGQNIVLHSDAKVPFTIKVIDSEEINAFALPGGFFFVNKGLLLAADNESELAGVMAHEIAHVTARHAMEAQGKGSLINYGMLATVILGVPVAAPIIQNGGNILAGLAQLKFTRGAESEADNLGVQYMYASGYDPNGMATMFEKLASMNKKKPGALARLFSTHPQPGDRQSNSLQIAARFPEKEEYIISTSEFQRVKSHLMKQTNAKAGITTDFDQTDDSRPTLKKRQPDSPDSTGDGTGDTSGSSSSNPDSGPPKLKKRDQSEPAPAPSPSPQP